MLDALTTLFIFATTTTVGTIIWGLRLEGEVRTAKALTDQRHEDLKELINAKFDFAGQRLERIEKALNGKLREH